MSLPWLSLSHSLSIRIEIPESKYRMIIAHLYISTMYRCKTNVNRADKNRMQRRYRPNRRDWQSSENECKWVEQQSFIIRKKRQNNLTKISDMLWWIVCLFIIDLNTWVSSRTFREANLFEYLEFAILFSPFRNRQNPSPFFEIFTST